MLSYLQITANTNQLAKSTNGSTTLEPGNAWGLCIHTDATCIYIDRNSTSHISLSDMSSSQILASSDFGRTKTRTLVSKWLFVASIITATIWWHVWWISSLNAIAWAIWLLAVAETASIIIIIATTRSEIKGFPD